MSAFAKSSRICDWAGRELVRFWIMFHTSSVGLTWGKGQASPQILFLSRPVYALTQQTRHGRAFPSITTKSWSTAPIYKAHTCLLDLILIVVPGQIFFNDGVQVCRTIIGDPTLTSNDSPHNLSCFWTQQSLNHMSPTLSKEINWLHQ